MPHPAGERPEVVNASIEDISTVIQSFITYLSISIDQQKLAAKDSIFKLLVTLSFLFSVGGAIIASIVFILLGTAQAIANLTAMGTPYPLWSGLLISGFGFLFILGFIVSYQFKKWSKASLKERMKQYE